MPLRECPPFADAPVEPLPAEAKAALERLTAAAPDFVDPLYLGFSPATDWSLPVHDLDRAVDAFFSLQNEAGFESRPNLLTFRLRASRFSLILFWEALHRLRTGGAWIDIDDSESYGRSPIGARDVLDRPYFAHSLERIQEIRIGRFTAGLWRKRHATLVSPRIGETGWTFGILTSGRSPQACRMVREIQALRLPEYEIVLCGPEPGPCLDEPRVRRIDLDRPEPRGWITRKKNLIAEEARFENLFLLHDRFRLPGNFSAAVGLLGPAPGITTFPQLFFPEPSRTAFYRNVDYQATLPVGECMRSAERLVNFRLDQFAYPRYNDWRETFHVNGGAYLARRSLWNAVPQDEALFHGEWEDVVHGIASHKFGIPQRVNPHTILESVYSHHALLAHLNLPRLEPDGAVVRRRGFVSSVFLAHRLLRPGRLKPIGRLTEKQLRAQAMEVLPRLPEGSRGAVRAVFDRPIRSLSSFWASLSRALRGAKPATRSEAIAMLELLRRCCASPVWHANYVQSWLRGIELDEGAWARLLDREQQYFLAWERLYPAFFDAPEGEAADEIYAEGGSRARRRSLQAMHWSSLGSRDLVHSRTSLGEQPSPASLPDEGDPVPWSIAATARLLQPLERLLVSPRLQRALERLARFDSRRVVARAASRLKRGAST